MRTTKMAPTHPRIGFGFVLELVLALVLLSASPISSQQLIYGEIDPFTSFEPADIYNICYPVPLFPATSVESPRVRTLQPVGQDIATCAVSGTCVDTVPGGMQIYGAKTNMVVEYNFHDDDAALQNRRLLSLGSHARITYDCGPNIDFSGGTIRTVYEDDKNTEVHNHQFAIDCTAGETLFSMSGMPDSARCSLNKLTWQIRGVAGLDCNSSSNFTMRRIGVATMENPNPCPLVDYTNNDYHSDISNAEGLLSDGTRTLDGYFTLNLNIGACTGVDYSYGELSPLRISGDIEASSVNFDYNTTSFSIPTRELAAYAGKLTIGLSCETPMSILSVTYLDTDGGNPLFGADISGCDDSGTYEVSFSFLDSETFCRIEKITVSVSIAGGKDCMTDAIQFNYFRFEGPPISTCPYNDPVVVPPPPAPPPADHVRGSGKACSIVPSDLDPDACFVDEGSASYFPAGVCSGSGSPINNLQMAFNHSIAGNITILPGTYSGPGNANITIPPHRDFNVHGLGDPDDIIIDLEGNDLGFITARVGDYRSFTFSNITFINGRRGAPYHSGGVMVISGAKYVRFSHCVFRDNWGGDTVGDVRVSGAALLLTNVSTVQVCACFFENNHIIGNRGAGGALYIEYADDVNFHDNLFVKNNAYGTSGSTIESFVMGGAVAFNHIDDLNIHNNTFCQNAAINRGGGFAAGGGAVFVSNAPCIL